VIGSRFVVSALLLAGACLAQDFSVNVPTRVRRQIGRLLPERSNAGAAYLSESYASNLVFSGAATVRVVFVREGAAYQNTLGYFTYTDQPDGSVTIDSADLLIPNASSPGAVQAGDGWDLKDAGGAVRTFAPGEKLGFFVLADGNRQTPTIVGGWTFDYSDGLGTVPSADPSVNEQRGRGCYTSVSRLNPEMLDGQPDRARHLIMVEMPGQAGFLGGVDYLMCGFEDLRRTGNSDDDFNDLVFAVEVQPLAAVAGTGVYKYEPGDPDGDGVRGLNDAFPNDPERATLERLPSNGYTLLAFEDLYPLRGDADFNDAVVAYAFEVARDANGDVKDIVGTFALIARGASYDASFGLHLPGLPPTATGTIDVERFVSGATSSTVAPQRTVQAIVASGTRRIEDVIDSTKAMLPPPPGYEFSNTLFAPGVQSAGSARIHVEFDAAVPSALLGDAPFDPFLYVHNPTYPSTRVDIHLPGWPSFPDRPGYLPVEQGPTAFVDGAGFPWALEVPGVWRFPMEEVDIEQAYLTFFFWMQSAGQSNQSWYENPVTTTGVVGPELSTIVPTRIWSIGIPR
jgi:LruC domain-containing protein